MKSSDILLSFVGGNLEVWKVGNDICVRYAYSWIDDGVALIGSFGRASDFEKACDDYLAKIRGKKLIFEGPGIERKSVTVLG